MNLVENAIKYSSTAAASRSDVLSESASVQIEVEDEGLGIPPAEQERIFEKFYRLDAAMTRGVGGSGLGLYISREIVTQIGGSLSVRSVPDVGLDVHRDAAAARLIVETAADGDPRRPVQSLSGGVPERSNGAVLKTAEAQASVSSNLTPAAF